MEVYRYILWTVNDELAVDKCIPYKSNILFLYH